MATEERWQRRDRKRAKKRKDAVMRGNRDWQHQENRVRREAREAKRWRDGH